VTTRSLRKRFSTTPVAAWRGVPDERTLTLPKDTLPGATACNCACWTKVRSWTFHASPPLAVRLDGLTSPVCGYALREQRSQVIICRGFANFGDF